MILTELNLSQQETNKRPTLLVPVPQWGENAEIMVTEMTIEGYVRLGNLQRNIMSAVDMDQTKRTAMLMCAQLLCVMIHPETGDFLLQESDLEKFYSTVQKDSLQALLLADAKMNPPREFIPLQEKKSHS
jgi:hypothetical protein